MEQLTDKQIEHARNIPISRILGLDSGRRRSVKCPFHPDKTPSCVIYANNSFYCFGCGATGQNAIDFVMLLGFGFKEAVDELARYG